MPRMRILIMEDDEPLARAMRNHLQHERYDVTLAPDGQEGIRLARNISPDGVIVDFNVRVVDALAVCRQLRVEELTRKIPILLLGKKEELSAPVVAAAGADDHLARPFAMKDLVKRVKDLGRRKEAGAAGDIIEHGALRIDWPGQQVALAGENIDLTPSEFRILECFMRQPGRVFSRRDLVEAAVGGGAIVLERTIDVHVKSIRRKLGPARTVIETVRGVGYRLRESLGMPESA